MKAPFPWFGGKRRIAAEIWAAFGDVANYVEPFAGSLAVLLDRPPQHVGSTETVNDKDAYVANFWRALVADPEAVAAAADWPVSEVDLFARHVWLVSTGRERVDRLLGDPDYYDAQIAGWWVWGLCSWIGSGWCAGTGPWTVADGLPHLGNTGRGVNRQLPHLGNTGRGVNRQLPHLGDSGRGVADYLGALAARLRRVRVCCGDWSRMVTDGALSAGSTVGVLLDPPYSTEHRTADLYATETADVAMECRDWALAHGDDPRLRIALCGYEGEHEMPAEWRVVEWASSGAYKGSGGDDCTAELNRHRERIWLSPSCIGQRQPGLFG